MLMMISAGTLMGTSASPAKVRRRTKRENLNSHDHDSYSTYTESPPEDSMYWNYLMVVVDSSLDTHSPSSQPTPAPTTNTPTMFPVTPSPSHNPSRSPIDIPSQVPSNTPTEEPSTSPSLNPSAKPTKMPSDSPSVEPTAENTDQPTTQTTDYPSTTPSQNNLLTIAPSESPSSPETPIPMVGMPTEKPSTFGICELDLDMDCLYGEDGLPCEEIIPEDKFICVCTECPKELTFTYTGLACNDEPECEDSGVGPGPTARIHIVNGDDSTDVLHAGVILEGQSLVLSRRDGTCLPDNLSFEIVGATGEASELQTLKVSSSCTDGSLRLLNSFGSLDFSGYSCSEDDTHNCMLDVLYEFNTCNVGPVDALLQSLIFNLTEDVNSTPVSDEQSDSLILAPSDCFKSTQIVSIDLCRENQYNASAAITGLSNRSGPPCEASDELQFGWEITTVSPTSSPTVILSVATELPSIFPTKIPSLTPTTKVCEAELNLLCVTSDLQDQCEDILMEEDLVCNCPQCPQEVTLIFTGNACDSSRNFTDQCLDMDSINDTAVVLVTEGNTTLFNGTLNFGEDFQISQADGDCLPEVLTVEVRSIEHDTILQMVELDTTCNNTDALTLLNSYGAFDFIGYSCDDSEIHNCMVDVTYLLAACNQDTVENLVLFDLDFDINGNTLDLLLGNAPRFLDPTECLQSFIPSMVERCIGTDYIATASFNASTTFIGPFCQNQTKLAFDTQVRPFGQ